MAYKKPQVIVIRDEHEFKRMCEALSKGDHVKCHYEHQGNVYENNEKRSDNDEFIWENKVTHEKKIIRYEQRK